MNRSICIALSLLSMSLACAAVLCAGPLNPPAGPVASTYKTLAEVEPRIAINAANTPGDADSLYKITLPGSYYLSANIIGVAGKHGIEIASGGVTVDLQGFDISGFVGMGAFDGVSMTVPGQANVAVVNGSIRKWGNDGIDLGTNSVRACRIEGIQTSGNTRYGILTGFNARISGCTTFGGLTGIYCSDSATLSGCSASDASSSGIVAAVGSTLINCSAYSNGSSGFEVGSGVTLSNCSAYSNAASGFTAFSGSTLANCSSYLNRGDGFNVGPGGTVEGCSASNNSLDGVRCSLGSTIRGNTCHTNGIGAGGGAGIHATGSDNRIEGNTCDTSDRGIDVDGSRNRIDNNSVNSNSVGFDIGGADNIVIRNTASGNAPNYLIGAGNSVAPRISVANSDGWAGITNANHPFANFGY